MSSVGYQWPRTAVKLVPIIRTSDEMASPVTPRWRSQPQRSRAMLQQELSGELA
ncbi:hypothetical protein [Streptosporangium subroseum]|uniref:hypothetical protein n=1 Tax=Streptosporangium subroseum TaxID=106412 RepID=UPI0015C5DEDA|nr:hypothetical protein [Streptosporangium subroseum]